MTDNTNYPITHSEPEKLPAVTQEQNAMQAIIKIASDPNMDIEKLKSLVAMQQNFMDRQAAQEFAADFALMKPNLPLIARLHDNTQTKSKYAKMEDVNKAVDPILAQYGFATSMKVIAQTETTVTGRVELIHRGGHKETTEITMPIDDRGIAGTVNKTKPHAIASTIMYIRRVGECALLNISTGDDKDGNQESKTISVEQAAELDTRLRAISDKALPNFLKWAKVERLIDIPAQHHGAMVKAVANMETEAKKTKV